MNFLSLYQLLITAEWMKICPCHLEIYHCNISEARRFLDSFPFQILCLLRTPVWDYTFISLCIWKKMLQNIIWLTLEQLGAKTFLSIFRGCSQENQQWHKLAFTAPKPLLSGCTRMEKRQEKGSWKKIYSKNYILLRNSLSALLAFLRLSFTLNHIIFICLVSSMQ